MTPQEHLSTVSPLGASKGNGTEPRCRRRISLPSRRMFLCFHRTTQQTFVRDGTGFRTGSWMNLKNRSASRTNWWQTRQKRLAEVFATERENLESEWDKTDNVSTEDLRLALRKYRSPFSTACSPSDRHIAGGAGPAAGRFCPARSTPDAFTACANAHRPWVAPHHGSHIHILCSPTRPDRDSSESSRTNPGSAPLAYNTFTTLNRPKAIRLPHSEQ